MYEPVAHETLNQILDALLERPDAPELDRTFLTRLGANFYAIHSLFQVLYGERDDVRKHLEDLVCVLANAYTERPAVLRERDRQREGDHTWFLDQRWVGMALYTDGFAHDLEGTTARLPYLTELGVNMVHLMPLLRCPPGASDGGYAVSDFRDVDPRVGTLDQLGALAHEMRERDMLLVLDVVLNHTSDEHKWACAARSGDPTYQGYYYTWSDRSEPDRYEQSMPEIFPETAPGNFTWNDEMGRWVMTVFHDYQWDLNYRNPAVFIEMLDIILFWANQGADVLRLDAVAFIWKRLGTSCQNQREAHLLLQLFKDCCQVTAPGVLFIAEAIVAPTEITKYFGEDAVVAKECEIAYNATLMALLWDAMATGNTRLLSQGIRSIPDKLDMATWLNYVRCHDDIGLGFDDADIAAAGYDPSSHRAFLVDWFSGTHAWSNARGARFGENLRTGDARIAGSLASLIGLEAAINDEDSDAVDLAIDRILLMHSVLMSFGGIPWLYYGDELGTLNDWSFQSDPHKSNDTRWVNRPRLTDQDRDERCVHGSVTERIFRGIQHLIAVRKTVAAFADHNNRLMVDTADEHLLAYLRTGPIDCPDPVLVVINVSPDPRQLDLGAISAIGRTGVSLSRDLITGRAMSMDKTLDVPGASALWLAR